MVEQNAPPRHDPPPLADTATVADNRSRVASPFIPDGADNRYELGDEIARGGMGIVYRATDTVFDREVAVKVLQEQFKPGSKAAQRFANEARITGQLQHPAIPPVHDLGTLKDGRVFLAMKLIKGQTFEEWLRSRADLAVDRGRFIAAFEAACQAVAYAHAHKVIHRDLKPTNVMVGSFGDVQVMDWGLAKILGADQVETTDPEATASYMAIASTQDTDDYFTQAGSILGTPAFMPPEQAIGAIDQIDERSDVFGLGAILCFILTGKPPFVSQSAESTRQLAARGAIADACERLDASGAESELIALCKQCLASDKRHRPANAGEVAVAVAEWRAMADLRAKQAELDQVKAEGAAATAQAMAAEQIKRRRVTVRLAAAIAIVLVAGIAVSASFAAWALQNAADAKKKESEVSAEQDRTKQALLSVQQEQERTQKALQGERRRRKQVRSALDIVAGAAVDDLLARKMELDPQQRAFLEKALALYQDLVQDVGDDEDLLHGAADAAISIGNIQMRLARTNEAELAFRTAIDLAKRLEKLFPGKQAAARTVQGTAWNNLGNLLRQMGRPGEAEKALAEALKLSADESLLSEARTAMNIALVRELNGDLLAAEEGYKSVIAKLAFVETSRAVTAESLALLAGCQLNLGSVLATRQQHAEAAVVLKKAVSASRVLLTIAPKNADYRNKLAKALHNLSGSLHNTGDPKGSDETIREAIEVEKELVKDYGGVPEYRVDLSNHYDRRAVFLRMAGKLGEAEPLARDAVREITKATEGRPDAAEFISQEAGLRENLATLLAECGKFDQAVPEMRRAQACWKKLNDPRYAFRLTYSRLNVMRMFLDQKKLAEMKSEAGTLAKECDAWLKGKLNEELAYQVAITYARALYYDESLMSGAIIAVRVAIAAGAFREASRLQELKNGRTFAMIRQNPAFQGLLADLNKKSTK